MQSDLAALVKSEMYKQGITQKKLAELLKYDIHKTFINQYTYYN